MTSSQSTSITDLPSPALEHIGEHLTVRNLNSLLSVNRKIYDTFNHSIIWRRYLHYPERYYKADVRSRSSNPRVRAVQEVISAGRLGKWRGYYLLQQARVATFQIRCNPQTVPFETITLQTLDVYGMYDMVDDHGEHWLFVHYNDFNNNNLHVWNITTCHRSVATLSMECPEDHRKDSRREVLEILPQGKVLIQEIRPHHKPIILVYKFESPEYSISFQQEFVYDMAAALSPDTAAPVTNDEEELDTLEECWGNFAHAVVGEKLVCCKKSGKFPELHQLSLHVWDLNDCTKSEVSLGKEKALVELLNCVLRDNPRLKSKYTITMHPDSESKKLFVHLHVPHEGLLYEQIYVLCFKAYQLTHLNTSNKSSAPRMIGLHTVGNKLCLAGLPNNANYVDVSILSIQKKENCLVQDGEATTQVMYESNFDVYPKIYSKMSDVVIFKKFTMVIVQGGCVVVIHLDTMREEKISLRSCTELQLGSWSQTTSMCPRVLCFIEPKFLLVHHISEVGLTLTVSIINMEDGSGSPLLTEEENLEICIGLLDYYSNLQYPSRLAFIRADLQLEDLLSLLNKTMVKPEPNQVRMFID